MASRRDLYAVLAVFLSASAWLLAEDVLVKHNVNLRPDPSASHAPILLLRPHDRLKLLEPDLTNGYYHVETEDVEEGWVWSHDVQLVPSAPQPPPPGTVATAIDPGWGRPSPNQTTFSDAGHAHPCGPTGDGADIETNGRKNRTDVPSDGFHDVEFDVLTALPMLIGASRKRNEWSPAQKDELKPFEGVAVRAVGYLVAVKVEDSHRSPHGESTNCHWTGTNEVDWHMALVKTAGQGEKDCVVVETTPRVRRDHPNWTPERLGPWLNSPVQVRISGWVMYDPDHPDHIGTFRQTLWEIHPVMRIEVFKNGDWLDLDDLP